MPEKVYTVSENIILRSLDLFIRPSFEGRASACIPVEPAKPSQASATS
jgi:hypothetical protein